MDQPRHVRREEFYRRLSEAAPASDAPGAQRLIEETLNAVEDALTTIPFNPAAWETDGRMYPVSPDNIHPVEGHPGTLRLRSKGHNTFVGPNGAIEIRTAPGDELVLKKAGADGKEVF